MPQYSGVWSLQQQMQALTSGQWVTDPLFDYTTLLLQGDAGANGAQNNVFYDTSPNQFAITRNGNTTQGTFSPFSLQPGEWSNYFPGSASISFSTSSGFNIDTYDCFECWVNFSSLGTSNLIAGREANFWLAYNHASIGGASNKLVFAIYNGSSWQAVSSNTTPVVGTWYHIAGIRDSGTLRLYINGVQENTATFSGSPSNNPAYNFFVGALNAGESMTGYVSNVRLVTGATAAVLPYTANFTPSPRPLTAVTGTQILTCQGSRFFDANTQTTAKTLGTITSTPSVQAFSPFAPQFQYTASGTGGSGYFDGSGDYLTTNNINLAANAFTIEGWFYVTTTAGNMNYWGMTNGGGSTPKAVLYMDNVGNLVFETGAVSGAVISVSISTYVKRNAWQHIAISRSGTGASQTAMFIDGVRVGTGTCASLSGITAGFNIGYVGEGFGVTFNGYIAGFRIVNGTAVYNPASTTVTIPTAPLTAVTNTALLTNFTNAGILDGTMKNNLETVGNAQVSTSVVKYGSGSMYFDGTGDYLRAPNSQNIAFGTGDFTIEMWLWFNATPTGDVVVMEARPSNTAVPWIITADATSGGTLYFYDGTTYRSTIPITPQAWMHFAVSRVNGTLRIFNNGVQGFSGTVTTSLNPTGSLIIGARNDGLVPFTGYMDDIRITKGFGRYTQNFIPPSVALPRQ